MLVIMLNFIFQDFFVLYEWNFEHFFKSKAQYIHEKFNGDLSLHGSLCLVLVNSVVLRVHTFVR